MMTAGMNGERMAIVLGRVEVTGKFYLAAP
jgi:hypothetical protein